MGMMIIGDQEYEVVDLAAREDIENLEDAVSDLQNVTAVNQTTCVDSHTGFATGTTPTVNIIKIGKLAIIHINGNVADASAGAVITLADGYKPKSMTGIVSAWPLTASKPLNTSNKSGDLYAASIMVAGSNIGKIYLWPAEAGMIDAHGYYPLP